MSLELQREDFARQAADLDEGAFNISQSEMSGEVSFDEEYADAGSFTFEREKELSIGYNIRDLVDKSTHALAAIARGTYGLCERCGDPIPKARLLALPYSTLCLRCKQQEERTR
ncbi:MAG: TraR/DksA C4-type zinc finger protein [Actinomycetota bacterium]